MAHRGYTRHTVDTRDTVSRPAPRATGQRPPAHTGTGVEATKLQEEMYTEARSLIVQWRTRASSLTPHSNVDQRQRSSDAEGRLDNIVRQAHRAEHQMHLQIFLLEQNLRLVDRVAKVFATDHVAGAQLPASRNDETLTTVLKYLAGGGNVSPFNDCLQAAEAQVAALYPK